MKIHHALLAAGLTPLLLAGCATQQATYVEASGPRTLATVGQINIQDFATAADKMVNSIILDVINGGKLKAASGQQAVLAISRVVNQTGQHFDMDELTKKIRIRLNQTGKIVTTTTVKYGGAEDPMARQAQVEQSLTGNPNATRSPDYFLSGKILDKQTRVGNLTQMAYVFQLSLTSPDGLAIWEGEETIVKQGNRSAVGF